MKKNSGKLIFTLIVLGALFFYGGHFVSAADIVNVDFPCPSGLGLGDCQPSADIPSYLNNLYKFAVGIAGLLALGMIVAGGVYYTVSAGSGDKQREAKDMITSALWGVALILGSYLILNTVNPQITTLNLDFSGAPPRPNPTSTGPIVDLQNSDCGDFSNLFVSVIEGSLPSCKNRKLITNIDIKIRESNYYDPGLWDKIWGGEGIKKGSMLWLYPYYLPDSGQKMCLIYAYREPGQKTIIVDFKDNLRLCAPQNQNINTVSCAKWTFTANGINDEFNPRCIPFVTCPTMTPVSSIVPVNKNDFNYPDINNPPPTNNDKTCPANTSTFKYCWDQKWTCTEIADSATAADYTTLPPNTLSNDEAVGKLKEVGILVESSGTPNCSDPTNSNCTSLQGIPGLVVEKLKDIANKCKESSGSPCSITVTGGTEVGHKTHGPGQPAVDLRFNSTLAKYLKDIYATGIDSLCTIADDAIYRISCEYNEPQRQLHVQFKQ